MDKNEPFDGMRDADLFSIMADQSRGADRTKAWGVVYERHKFDLQEYWQSEPGLLLSQQISADDLVNVAMLRAFRSAHTYRALEKGTQAEERRKTHYWLRTIAKRALIDSFRAKKNDEARHEAFIDDWKSRAETMSLDHDPARTGSRFGTTPARQMKPERSAISEAMDALEERSKEILLRSLDYFDRESGAFSPPKNVIKEICEEHGISEDNYRQIRYRAWRQFQQAVSSNLEVSRERVRHATS